MDLGRNFLEKNMHRKDELNQNQFGANRSSLCEESESHSKSDVSPYPSSKTFNIWGSNCREVDAICTVKICGVRLI